MSDVPESIACLVEAAGVDTVLAFLEAFGGKPFYVPKSAEGSLVSRMFGDEFAVALARNFGRGAWNVPMCKAWRVTCYRNQGLSVSEIATRMGLSARQVYTTLQRAREAGVYVAAPRRYTDDRQISLL